MFNVECYFYFAWPDPPECLTLDIAAHGQHTLILLNHKRLEALSP
jgi:hypothetical protein